MTALIIGAGPIGMTLAQQLTAAGHDIRIGTRSGSGLEHPLASRVQLDATDASAVREAAADCDVIYHCMHAPYSAAAWRAALPTAEVSVLAAARSTGSTVVFPESLYGFDASTMPIRETVPLNARGGKREVRVDLIEARSAAGVRCRSVVASDYYGPGAGPHVHAGDRMIEPILKGRAVRPMGSADQPHSFTFLPDLAQAMVRATELPDSRHRLLFAPTSEPVTQRQLIAAFAEAAGVELPKISPLAPWLVRSIGLVHGPTRELTELLYQFDRPFTMDSTASEQDLGLAPTPIAEGVRRVMSAKLTSPA